MCVHTDIIYLYLYVRAEIVSNVNSIILAGIGQDSLLNHNRFIRIQRVIYTVQFTLGYTPPRRRGAMVPSTSTRRSLGSTLAFFSPTRNGRRRTKIPHGTARTTFVFVLARKSDQ